MGKTTNIQSTLNALADAYIEAYKTTVGDMPNDYFITDVARSLTKIPAWTAAQKRQYVDKLYQDVEDQLTFDSQGKDNPTKSKQYYDKKAKAERLGPRIELEAMALDAVFELHKRWFEEYTGQEFTLDTKSQPARKLSKQEQHALQLIEARRVAAG